MKNVDFQSIYSVLRISGTVWEQDFSPTYPEFPAKRSGEFMANMSFNTILHGLYCGRPRGKGEETVGEEQLNTKAIKEDQRKMTTIPIDLLPT